MKESQLLRLIYDRSRDLTEHPAVIVGPGDDAAVLELDGFTVMTVDQLVEDRHFDASAPIDLIARKAMARSVSDIAAMGAEPRLALATGALRDDFDGEDELFGRLSEWARHFDAPLVGGDIARTSGPTVLTTTVVGRSLSRKGPALRSGARSGDLICVTGRLGGSLRSGRHLTFEPRVPEGRWLVDEIGVTSMIDLSDGLGRDAGRVARASGVCMRIETHRIPMSDGVADWMEAAGDGEDYELLFTLPASRARSMSDACPSTGVSVTVIGDVKEGPIGCVFASPDGSARQGDELGWDH